MEEKNPAPAPNNGPAPQADPAPAPTQAPPQNAAPAPAEPKKKSPWPWIIGGCLIIILLILVAVIYLGWWGYKKAQPAFNEIKGSIEEINEETEAWKQKSEEFRETLPNPEEFEQEFNIDESQVE